MSNEPEQAVLVERLEKWRRRARLFRRGYKDASFEAFGLELQKMQLEAYGANQVLPMQNESLRKRLLGACRERNEYKRQRDDLSEEIERCHRLLDVYYGESLETVAIDTLEHRLEGLLAELKEGEKR